MTTNLNPFTCQFESFKVSTKSTTARPISCDKCFKRPYPFIFNSESICHGLTNSSVSLFVFVLTTHNQQERRDVLRNTWASLSRNNTSPFFRYVFLLGSSGKESRRKLQAENNIHHDMALQNFTDSYRNLTLKTNKLWDIMESNILEDIHISCPIKSFKVSSFREQRTKE